MTDQDQTVDQPMNLAVTDEDWQSSRDAWVAAARRSLAALEAIQWPSPALSSLDAWLSATDDEQIARTRLAALCELQWQRK